MSPDDPAGLADQHREALAAMVEAVNSSDAQLSATAAIGAPPFLSEARR
jgi:hypothetical protein